MPIEYMPYAQRAAEIERQRRYAELLQQQAAEPLQSQMVGNRVVPISPWLGLAKMLQAGLGGYAERKAGEREAEMKKQAREEYKQNVQDFISALGPQKQTTQVPLAKDITQAAGPEDYQDIMNQPYQTRDMAQAATPEDVQDILNQPYVTKDVTSYTPGLSRNQAIARLLEMQGSENPYIAAAAPTLTGLLPKQTDATDLFNKLDMSKLTPESVQEVLASGDIGKAKFAEETMTPYQIAELKMREEDNKVRAAEAAVDNARSDAQLKNAQANLALAQQGRDQSRKEFEYNYPNLAGQYTPAPVSTVQPPSGMTAPQPAGQQPVQQVTQPASKPLSRQDQMAYNAKVEPLNDAAIKLANYKQALNEVSRSGSIAGAGAGQLKTAYSNALAAVRVLQNTGVYNPGEAFLLDKALRDASTITSIVDPTSRDQIIAQLEEQFKNLDAKKGVIDTQFQQAPTPLIIGAEKSKAGETAAQRAKRLGL